MRQTTLLAGVIAILAGLFAAPSPGQTAPIAAGWGTENAGELGNGPPLTGLSVPGPVLNAAGGCCLDHLVDLQTGIAHTLALDTQQRLWTWGDNSAGQLGIGSLSP